MSSRPSHRLTVSALLLAVLLALGAPPVQATSPTAGALEALGAKVQTWLAGWLPGSAVESRGMIDPNGHVYQAVPSPKSLATGGSGHTAGRAPRGGGIKVQCVGTPDPNGCPH